MPPRSQPKPVVTAGVTPPHVNAAGQSQLWIAASVGDVAKVRSLLAASGGALLVNLQANNGASPLYAACRQGHTDVVCALLSAGAKVGLQITNGFSPLHAACLQGPSEVVRTLLSAGAKVDLQSQEGGSPLSMPARPRRGGPHPAVSWSPDQPAVQCWCYPPVCCMLWSPHGGGPRSAIS